MIDQGRSHRYGWSGFHRTTFRVTETFIKPRRVMSRGISHSCARACSGRVINHDVVSKHYS